MDWLHITLLNLVVTAYMTGVIWMCQIVHYPLLSKVGIDHLPDYQLANTRLTTWVVLPPMLAELGLTVWMLTAAPTVQMSLVVTGAGLLAVCWGSTFLFQVPQHRRLLHSFEKPAWLKLVRSNWIRTVAWSARTVIACLLLW